MSPVMRLDHVVFSTAVTVLSAEVQRSPGSDHLWLALELAIRPADIPIGA